MKEQAEIEVPGVEVTTKVATVNHCRNRKTCVRYDMDNIKTDVNSSFKDKFDFVVTTARVDNETKFIFVIETSETTRLSRLRRWKSSTRAITK